jgi:hypothetical protein
MLVSIPNGQPRPFRQERTRAPRAYRVVSIPNGLERPFSPGEEDRFRRCALPFQSLAGEVEGQNGLRHLTMFEVFP